ncbi:MAG: DNA polymerase III subunit delta [Burkholderiaceae bacterium]
MAPKFFLLHGPDEFASAEFVEALKAKLGDPTFAELNTTVMDGRTVSLSDVRATADTMPFLTSRRLVVVEGWLTRLLGRAAVARDRDEDDDADDDAEDSPGGRAPGTAREQMAALLAYLPDLPETTALVLVERRQLPPRNAILLAAAAADWGQVKLFDLPKGDTLIRWIRARAKAEGGEIDHEAAEALAEVESDPRALGNEITKLLTYAGFARPVGVDDVQTLTPAGGEAKIFDMVDAVGQRRGPAAQRELHRLLESAEPLYVLTMIVRQFRLLLQAREMLDQRRGEGEISQALNLHPFPTGKVCQQARSFSLPDLERIYRRLLEYDVDIKSGQMEAATALDTLVGALTSSN